YSETDTKQQALVYRESIDEDGVLILADTYFPVEGMAKDIYQSYTTKYLPEDTKILSTFNHVLESDKDDGILVHSQLYENEQAKVLFKNSATESQRLFQFDIRADVLYANGEDELVVPSTAKKLEDISFKYVHDGDDAKEFANSLHNNIIRNGSYKYKFTSTNNYMLGNKYNLITRDYNKNVLIIGKSWNDYTKAYKYECVEVEQRVTSTMRTRSFRMSSTQPVLPPLARIITLTGNSPNILYSSRGTLLTQEVIFTVGVTNIDLNSVVWDCNIGNEYLEDVLDEFGNPILNKKVLLTDEITEGVVVVTVYAIIDEHTYSASYSVSVVSEGLPTPLYLGAVEDVPLVTDEGPLYKGDFFLYTGGTAPIAPDKNSEEYLNPQLAEVNEFIYGRMYEFVGVDELGIDLWQETRKSECFASAQKDALEIAKNSNAYLYCAVVVAQLGLFNDLMVANILESTNYDYYKESDRDTNPASPTYNKIIGLDGKEHELGEPKKGFQLDGPRDTIKAFAMEAYNSKIFGTVESTGFKTLTGTDPITIPRTITPKNIWKYSDMFLDSLIANQDTFHTKSGTIEGFAFTQATKRYNTRIKIASASPYSRNFGAGDIDTMRTIYPDFVFGRSIYVVARGKYDG
ncbi:MAG TPA: hypothetical protein VFC79_14490, partial [Tissierellaceae bacterium]|nr:hypothetical protein [Tissierellaceae bacterium]